MRFLRAFWSDDVAEQHGIMGVVAVEFYSCLVTFTDSRPHSATAMRRNVIQSQLSLNIVGNSTKSYNKGLVVFRHFSAGMLQP